MRNPTPFITSPNQNLDTQGLSKDGVVLEVRGHGFRFLVRIPKEKFWKNRRELMLQKKIKFRVIPHGETILIRGHKVKLYNKSLDVYFARGWSSYADSAESSWKNALVELKAILVDFENLFDFKLGKVEWRVCKQHYSLVKNALARDYLFKKEKLHVWAKDGKLWMLIDNSFNLEECETVHTKSARDDNRKVQDFFNGVKDTGITPQFILQGFDNLIKDRQYVDVQLKQYAENIKTHIEAIQKLGDGVERLTKEIARKK
jgi:hypothetical protein